MCILGANIALNAIATYRNSSCLSLSAQVSAFRVDSVKTTSLFTDIWPDLFVYLLLFFSGAGLASQFDATGQQFDNNSSDEKIHEATASFCLSYRKCRW